MDVIPRIRSARWVDKDSVAALIADAVHPIPLAQWLVPDPAARRHVLADVATIWVEHAMFHGDIQITDDLSAATVAFHRYRPIAPPANFRIRLDTVAGTHVQRFAVLDQLLTNQRPFDPHHHLAILAVRPDAQRRGLGAAMLTHHEARLDRINLPAWTETLPTTQDLYLRHRYLPRPTLTLPDGPTVTLMHRAPRPARESGRLNATNPTAVAETLVRPVAPE
ncbi:GNAT family N-acetyltransferase [Micromonospora sp. NBC_00330]|uniref:GNAT family N-acetyltransferase n=1 Tax=Micromonospora sp. NBC_00330 TaxID=2903585 RepID=UPI002E2B20B2|nr:GNAT family N-acetyltransferase [Micromonospora sp. NBC_00330]